MDKLEKYEFNRHKIYYDKVSNSYKVGTNPYKDYTKNQLYELFYNHPDDWKFLYGRGNVIERNRSFYLFDEIDYKHLYIFCIEEQGNEDYVNYIIKKYKYKINYDAFVKNENNYIDYIFRCYTSKDNKNNIEVYKFIRFLSSTLYNKEFRNYLHNNSINPFFN